MRSRLSLPSDERRRRLARDAVGRHLAWAGTVAAITSVALAVLPARAEDDTKPPFTTINSPPEFGLLLPLSVVRGTVTDEGSGVAEVLVSLSDPLGNQAAFENDGRATLDCNGLRTFCRWEAWFAWEASILVPPQKLAANATDLAANRESPGHRITVFYLP